LNIQNVLTYYDDGGVGGGGDDDDDDDASSWRPSLADEWSWMRLRLKWEIVKISDSSMTRSAYSHRQKRRSCRRSCA